jgi:hypothetical protein
MFLILISLSTHAFTVRKVVPRRSLRCLDGEFPAGAQQSELSTAAAVPKRRGIPYDSQVRIPVVYSRRRQTKWTHLGKAARNLLHVALEARP